MGHNLDITNGQASFVSARQDAWHSLGTTLPEGFTAEEAMKHGLLGGWNVRKAPLFTLDGAGKQITVPGRNAVLRDNPVTKGQVDVLGDVGDSYHVIQNEDHAEFLNALVDESGAHFETAGAIDGGRKVFITMKLPGHMLVGGTDQVDQYIAALNSHDGSKAFTVMITPVRIVCQNTLNLALSSAQQTFRVRHTSGATRSVGEARKVLDLTFDYLDEFQTEADRLINTEMTLSQFEQMIEANFGIKDGDAAAATVTRTENKLQEMSRLFADSVTHEGVRNTAWAGLNAMTEWADHFSPTRGEDRDEARSVKAVLDPAWKNKALSVVRSYAAA